MKVLMRDEFLPGSPYSLELCKQLKKYADLTLLCRPDAGMVEKEVNCKKIIYTKASNKIISVYRYIKSLIDEVMELKKGNYDVYHIQTYKNLYVEVFLFFIAKRYCRAVVTTVHNVLPHTISKNDRKLHQMWYKVSDALIAHNEATKACLIKEFPFTSSKVFVIPHGANTVRKGKGKNNSKSDNRVNFLLFGQLRPYKGVDILIRAITYLSAETRARIRVTIAGNQQPKEDRTDYVELIRRYQVEDCVDFQKRRVPDEKLPVIFGAADFCLFPYREIYGSGALLMAYTYNKPVIASDVPAFIEETAHGRTGLLFENGNLEDLARRIEEAVFMKQEDIDSYKKAVSALVREKYNWEISAAKLMEVYENVVRNRLKK